jgi:Domain of unknown function (DUF5104)
MLVRRVLAALMVLGCVVLLSSCTLLPPSDPSLQQSDLEMQHISDAVKHHDVAALKELFSKAAREKATDLDSGLKYFLSVFPSGFKNWSDPDGGPGETGDYAYGKRTVLLFGNYKVSANGKTYDLYFADYTVNQVDDRDNVGLYALGVAPYNAHPFTKPTAASKAFNTWASQFDIKNHTAIGNPGVYVPQK